MKNVLAGLLMGIFISLVLPAQGGSDEENVEETKPSHRLLARCIAYVYFEDIGGAYRVTVAQLANCEPLRSASRSGAQQEEQGVYM